MNSIWSKSYLIFEFCAVFILLPFYLRYLPGKISPIPLLWGATALCLVVLLRDCSSNRRQLWNPGPLSAELQSILLLFGVSSLILALGVSIFAPHLLFIFLRTHPGLWVLVILLYPALSVYPQGLIYRAFILHRYAPIFGSRMTLILASATAFSLMHIIFRNPVAIALTFVGGILFAYRYEKSGSLFVSSFEHALYGCFLFTIGLGGYFYVSVI